MAVFLDLNRWRDVVYVFVAFPLTLLELVVAAVLWVGSLVLLSMPLWLGTPLGPATAGLPAPTAAIVGIGFVVGVVLVMVAASVSRGLMTLHRAVVEGLLCESERQVLARRVETLEGSRRAVLDVEASELRRIERDLHDGAQQRLVMLTIDLGLAAEKIESDPAAAKGLVLEAQGEARQALADIRDLVRGIAPSILLDRGLVPALGAIAARSPVPTVVSSTLPDGQRLPDSAERAAYFVVAEALANVAKHAAATRCEIRCAIEGGRLVVEVRDDGAGGARIVPGGGLAGLQGRVEALDGTLGVDSPADGPTVVRAEIPVGVIIAPGAAPGSATTAPGPRPLPGLAVPGRPPESVSPTVSPGPAEATLPPAPGSRP
jgi:signal transduction histidine kinase